MLKAVETLRKQLVKIANANFDPLQKYSKHEELIQVYKENEGICDKIKEEFKVMIKKDLLDLQLEKVRLRTEAEMLDQAIVALEVKYAE